jgi:uncharacterized protein
MSRVMHFEVHATDPARLEKFYTEVLGWSFTKWDGPADYWLIETGPEGTPGINGGMLRRMGAAPPEGAPVCAFVCTVGVGSLDEVLARAAAAGGAVAMARMPVPGIGWLAYLKDPDGNIFGVLQPDASVSAS